MPIFMKDIELDMINQGQRSEVVLRFGLQYFKFKKSHKIISIEYLVANRFNSEAEILYLIF
jgi:hypothetical protein